MAAGLRAIRACVCRTGRPGPGPRRRLRRVTRMAARSHADRESGHCDGRPAAFRFRRTRKSKIRARPGFRQAAVASPKRPMRPTRIGRAGVFSGPRRGAGRPPSLPPQGGGASPGSARPTPRRRHGNSSRIGTGHLQARRDRALVGPGQPVLQPLGPAGAIRIRNDDSNTLRGNKAGRQSAPSAQVS